tara:strand:- start:2590 stop:2805 length:216 start_codon:yes stop_codon:yes gene_type:complete
MEIIDKEFIPEVSISSLLEEKHGLCQLCLDASEITISSSLEEIKEEGLKNYLCLLLKEIKEVEKELNQINK